MFSQHKVLVFVPTTNEQQRFVLTGAFDLLAEEYELSFVLPEQHAERMIAESGGRLTDENTHRVSLPAERFAVWRDLFAADCVKYGHLSESFQLRSGLGHMDRGHRLLRRMGPRLLERLDGTLRLAGAERARKTGFRRRLLKSAKREIKYQRVARRGEKGAYDALSERMLAMGPSSEIVDIVRDAQPLMCIVPSSLLDPMCNEVAWVRQELGVPCLVLQSGWDNLSSKGRIAFDGCSMGVWGPQSANHAKRMQGVSRSAMIGVGCPHYGPLRQLEESERDELRASLGVLPDEKLVLFGGSFRPFDETAQLQTLERAVEAGVLPGMRFVYRPHPWRADRKREQSFFDLDWKHVIFDPDMRSRYESSKAEPGSMKRSNPLFEMEYLARLLSACDAVISPMSTLLIESLIMRRPTLAVCYPDGKHSHSPDVTSRMTHFQELRGAPSVLWCRKAKKLVTMTARLFNTGEDAPGSQRSLDASAAILEKVVVRSPGTYAERLRDEVLTKMDAKVRKVFHKRRTAERETMNQIYGIDHIARTHCGVAGESLAVPGYWMHGWHPGFHAVHPSMLAVHKKMSGQGKGFDFKPLIEQEKRTGWQWVAREDQAAYLREHGYKHVEAIGLPAVYARPALRQRVAGSLLVMPPHGHRCHGHGDPVADEYARQVERISGDFSEVVVCVSDGDYAERQWVTQFRERGLRVISGAVSTRPDTLADVLGLMSCFEFVTTNGFGSHIAYAAYMGAKVSIWGPFAPFPRERMRKTHRAKAYPELLDVGYRLHAEPAVREHLGELFVDPWKAEDRSEWGGAEIGADHRREPDELARLFGWDESQEVCVNAGVGGVLSSTGRLA